MRAFLATLLLPCFAWAAPYAVNPTNSATIVQDTMVLHMRTDPDIPEWKNIVLLKRASPLVEWQGVMTLCGSDCWTGGAGWEAFARSLIDRTNAKVAEVTGAPSPMPSLNPLPNPAPTSWEAAVAWVIANYKTSTAPQPPPASNDVLWGARSFFGGYAFEIGIYKDGSPACRVQSDGWKVGKF